MFIGMVINIDRFDYFFHRFKSHDIFIDTDSINSIISYVWCNYNIGNSSNMNITSPNEMYRFLIGNGIVGICPEAQNLVACMDVLVRMCACDPPQAKQAKFNQCVGHYVSFVNRAQSLAPTLLSKAIDNRMSFSLNGQSIGNISR